MRIKKMLCALLVLAVCFCGFNTAAEDIPAINGDETVYTIYAEAGNGGTITPEGNCYVSGGNNCTFIIIPDSGYNISYVTVDGMIIGATSFYTFERVDGDHNIYAYFEPAELDERTVSGIPDRIRRGVDGRVSVSASPEIYDSRVVLNVYDGGDTGMTVTGPLSDGTYIISTSGTGTATVLATVIDVYTGETVYSKYIPVTVVDTEYFYAGYLNSVVFTAVRSSGTPVFTANQVDSNDGKITDVTGKMGNIDIYSCYIISVDGGEVETPFLVSIAMNEDLEGRTAVIWYQRDDGTLDLHKSIISDGMITIEEYGMGKCVVGFEKVGARGINVVFILVCVALLVIAAVVLIVILVSRHEKEYMIPGDDEDYGNGAV